MDLCIAAGASGLLTLLVLGLAFSASMQSESGAWRAAVLLLFSWTLTGALALRGMRGSDLVRLRWDGQGWAYGQGEGAACTVHLALDLHHWMLLRVEPESGSCEWLWLRRKAQVKQWPALRRALIFSAMIADDAAGVDPLGRLV